MIRHRSRKFLLLFLWIIFRSGRTGGRNCVAFYACKETAACA